MRSSLELLLVAIIEKSLMENGWFCCSQWIRGDECWGFDSGLDVLWDIYTFMLIKNVHLRLLCCAPYVRTIASSTRVFINNIRAQVRRKSIFIVKINDAIVKELQFLIAIASLQCFYQHKGISHRTSRTLSNPQHSSPRIHCEQQNHPFSIKDFSIIATSNNSSELRILESLYIYNREPDLNIDQSATPLFMF